VGFFLGDLCSLKVFWPAVSFFFSRGPFSPPPFFHTEKVSLLRGYPCVFFPLSTTDLIFFRLLYDADFSFFSSHFATTIPHFLISKKRVRRLRPSILHFGLQLGQFLKRWRDQSRSSSTTQLVFTARIIDGYVTPLSPSLRYPALLKSFQPLCLPFFSTSFFFLVQWEAL